MLTKSAKLLIASCFLAAAGLSGCASYSGSEPQANYKPYKPEARTPSAYEEPSKDYHWDLRTQKFEAPGKPYLQ